MFVALVLLLGSRRSIAIRCGWPSSPFIQFIASGEVNRYSRTRSAECPGQFDAKASVNITHFFNFGS